MDPAPRTLCSWFDAKRRVDLMWSAGVAVIYFAAAQLGFSLTFENGASSLLWAPTGLALAIFLLRGPRMLPALLVGSLAAEFTRWGFAFAPIEISIVNVLMPMVAARVLVGVCGPTFDLGRMRDIAAFAVFGAFLPMTMSAANGIAVLRWAGEISPATAPAAWLAWWVGDFAGAIVVAPVVLAWFENRSLAWRGAKCVELIIAALTVIAVSVFSFTASTPTLYPVFPLIMWIALRFTLRESSTAVFLTSVIAALAAIMGQGVYADSAIDDRLLALGLFMTAASLMAMTANAWISAHRDAERQLLRASEERLRDSEERFRNAFDRASVGMSLVSRNGRWLRVNETLCDILGYSETEMLARDFQSVTHPDDLAMDLALLEGLCIGKIAARQQAKRYIHKSGSIVWALINVSAVRDADGKPLYFVCQTIDITARKNDEMARDALMQRLCKLEEIGHVGGWYIDRHTYQQTLTPGMRAILDIAPSEDVAQHPILKPFWTKPENTKLPDLRDALQAAMHDGIPLDLIIQTVTAKNRQVSLHLRAEPVYKNGEIVGLSGYAQDVTLQHQLRKKVVASQKMEAIGQLTAGIAHDFNNMLAAISLNLEIIADEPTSTSFQRRRAQVAKNACDRGAKLTRQLLAFARKQVLVPRRHDLSSLVRNSATLLEHALPTNITVQVAPSIGGSVWAEVDQSQFDNALLNLALNGRDAMSEGGSLVISASTREIGAGSNKSLRPGRYAVVAVRDTGVGMSDAVAARAFDPFFTTKAFGQGSGLGLSMVHGFVNQSGGDVEIHSVPGEGTTVEMLFPLAAWAHNDDGGTIASASSAFDGEALRVLLVEDSDDVREACRLQLEAMGFEVEAAHNGSVAQHLIEEGMTFDILVTDLDMPGGIDGNRLADFAAGKIPGLKVITMTGYNEGRLKMHSESQTSTRRAHLQKPFSRTDLEAALTRLIGQKDSRRGVA